VSGKRSRDKGARGELEVVELVRAAGWINATRNFDSGSAGNGDVAFGPAATLIESKFTDSFALRQCWTQATTDANHAGVGILPIVAHRWTRQTTWLAITELEELLALLWMRERE
jgi:hypothetical protein